MNDMQPDNMNAMPDGQPDREGAMAKADLYKLANYSLKLYKQIQDTDQLEGWVQAKITKAADYIASVYHYLEYEMKISEYGEHLANAEVMSESKKQAIKHKLVEAKAKVAELKKAQAEKLKGKEKKMDEGMSHHTCEMCGGSGTVEREIPEELKTKVAAYNRQAKAFAAAAKRIDRNKNGIPDALEKDSEELTGEGFGDNAKAGDTFKTQHGTATKTKTGLVHTRDAKPEDDEDYVPPKKPSKAAKSAAEKKADKEKEIKLPKPAKGTRVYGMKNGEKFDRTVEESKLKGGQKKLDVDDDGDIEADDLADLRAGKKKEAKVDEAKGKKPDFLDMDKDGDKKEPMKKAVADKKKGAVKEEMKVGEKKPSSTGGTIEKTKTGVKHTAGKNYGGETAEKEDKKKVKESAEVIAESADLSRMKQFLTRLIG